MTTITIDHAVVEQALEALKSCSGVPHWPTFQTTIDALRAALAQEQAKPVQEPAELPLEDALSKAYYYTEEGKWRGAKAREWDRWHAVAKAAVALIRPERPETREHVTDGTPCWCGSEAVYTDPDTGASVVLHKRPQ